MLPILNFFYSIFQVLLPVGGIFIALNPDGLRPSTEFWAAALPVSTPKLTHARIFRCKGAEVRSYFCLYRFRENPDSAPWGITHHNSYAENSIFNADSAPWGVTQHNYVENSIFKVIDYSFKKLLYVNIRYISIIYSFIAG